MATTADEVWQLLGELIEVQKQTDHRLNEIECRLQETEKILKKLCLETKTEPLKLSNIILDSSSDFKKWRLRPIVHQLFQEREITTCELWSEIVREQDGIYSS